jgi:hypothetical protein
MTLDVIYTDLFFFSLSGTFYSTEIDFILLKY